MSTAMITTWAMIIGGPLVWLGLRVTAFANRAVVAWVVVFGARLGLLLFIIADGLLLLSSMDSGAHTAGIVIWVLAGAFTAWVTGRRRWSLSGLVDSWSAKRETALRAAAEAGDPNAAHALGLGLKLRGDLDQARTFLTQAADAGLPNAQWDLARLVDQMDGAEAARPWFEAAARAGHPGARHLLRLRSE